MGIYGLTYSLYHPEGSQRIRTDVKLLNIGSTASSTFQAFTYPLMILNQMRVEKVSIFCNAVTLRQIKTLFSMTAVNVMVKHTNKHTVTLSMSLLSTFIPPGFIAFLSPGGESVNASLSLKVNVVIFIIKCLNITIKISSVGTPNSVYHKLWLIAYLLITHEFLNLEMMTSKKNRGHLFITVSTLKIPYFLPLC